MTDLRTMLDDAVPAFDRGDPVTAVRRRVAERARRRHRLAVGGSAVAVAGFAAAVTYGEALLPAPGRALVPAAGGTKTAEPSPTYDPYSGDPRYQRLGEFVASNTEVFFGWYVDESDGMAVVAYQPDGETPYWAERLDEVAGTVRYRTKTCPVHSRPADAGAVSWADPERCQAGTYDQDDVQVQELPATSPTKSAPAGS